MVRCSWAARMLISRVGLWRICSPPPVAAVRLVAIEVVPVDELPGGVGGAALACEGDCRRDRLATADRRPGAPLGRGELDLEDPLLGYCPPCRQADELSVRERRGLGDGYRGHEQVLSPSRRSGCG